MNFTAENINVEPKFPIFWHPFSNIFQAIFGFVCQQKVTLQQFISGTTLKSNYTVINVVFTASLAKVSCQKFPAFFNLDFFAQCLNLFVGKK